MKKTLCLILLSFFCFLSQEAVAQKLSAKEQKKVNDIFKKGKTAYFKFPVSSVQEVKPLSQIITVDRMEGKMCFAHANKDAFSKFIVKGYPYTIIKVTNSGTKPKSKK
ncbi:MAG: hypothetical protein K0S44_1651 [Bacteroidetes bacterium]|jgi:archaeosine-15-forming tRNA-guanine transglycosylase|nr:hypothetical protein [Bacteroidota bacterium]